MSESISLPVNCSKEEIYRALLPQIEAVISGTDDLIANLANVAAIRSMRSIFTGLDLTGRQHQNF